MTDYTQLKVPDLKKLLSERGLPISGNKADLIARLQENDKKPTNGAAGEDEIDWDEDDHKAPAAPAAAAGSLGQVTNPPAVPNQNVDVEPAKAGKVSGGDDASKAAADAPTAEAAPAAEAPKEDFTMGIQQTDAEKEAEKRAARAKRFGIPEDDEANKLAERAKKFGLDSKETIVKGLDSALPERRQKRGREDREGGRSAKRQTPDRRTEAAPKAVAAAKAKKPAGRILDDPAEKAKAEARAKRFQQAA